MKIWIAKMCLVYLSNGTYNILFSTQQSDKNYRWIKEKGLWEEISDRLLIENKIIYDEPILKHMVDSIIVKQGFSVEPTKEELMLVKRKMVKIIKDYLDEQKDMYLKGYNNKLKALNEFK